MKRILVVEDDIGVRGLIKDLLSIYELRVIEAGDAEEAMIELKIARPDLIVMDHVLPGISGYETIRRLQMDEHTKSIPVIMITAKKFDAQMKEIIKLDAVDFIEKPFAHERLIQSIEKFLGKLSQKI